MTRGNEPIQGLNVDALSDEDLLLCAAIVDGLVETLAASGHLVADHAVPEELRPGLIAVAGAALQRRGWTAPDRA